MQYRKILEIGAPIAVAAGTIAGAEMSGLADWFATSNIDMGVRYGQLSREVGEFLRPYNHAIADAGLALYTSVAVYFIPKIPFRKIRNL